MTTVTSLVSLRTSVSCLLSTKQDIEQHFPYTEQLHWQLGLSEETKNSYIIGNGANLLDEFSCIQQACGPT
jgi:hypothetical protein